MLLQQKPKICVNGFESECLGLEVKVNGKVLVESGKAVRKLLLGD